MMITQSVAIILLSIAVFLALAVWLAMDNDHMEQWTAAAFTVAIVGGLCIYGSINASNYRSEPLIAVLHTVVDLGKMFGGGSDDSYESFVKLFGNGAFFRRLYWIVHFFAYYSLVSAVILLLGKGVVRKLRALLFHIRDIELIYGVNENTVSFGKHLSEDRHVSVVYVGDGDQQETVIRQMGGVWYGDVAATKPNISFLKRLAVRKGRGHLRVSALAEDADANLTYALELLRCLEARKIDPSQTELIILGRENLDYAGLQALGDHYGYGNVQVFDKAELAARLLMQNFPICDTIPFDKDAKALQDVEILLVGFGHVGQTLLRKLVANGQFEGSSFHVRVFDPDLKKNSGFFDKRYAAMLQRYDIQFEPYDGRSEQLVGYVAQKASQLVYLAIAVGDEKTGQEIADGLLQVLKDCGVDRPVYQCLPDRVIRYQIQKPRQTFDIYDADILYHGRMDKLAKEINHYYCGEEASAEDQWKTCDYFSRMSCRASADYLDSLLKHLGISPQKALAGERMENLAKSEHLRWCAFHYSMGYACMSEETKAERAELYKQDASVRVTKDPEHRLHACLIPWEELDALSAWESEVCDRNPDYKQMDRDNIEAIRRLIEKQAEREQEPGKKGKKRKRVLIPIALLVVAVIIGGGILIYTAVTRKTGAVSYAKGHIITPYMENIQAVPDDISYQTARSLLGDSVSERFVPSDEAPPSAYPVSWDDPKLLTVLKQQYPQTRDQGNYGTCWAHAATAAAELSMIKQGYADTTVDYSELHLAYFTYNNGTNPTMGDTGDRIAVMDSEETWLDFGGFPQLAALTLAGRRGIAAEKYVPYGAAEEVVAGGIPSEYEYRDEAYLKNALFINMEYNAKQVKQAIMELGGASAAIHAPDNWGEVVAYYNEKTNAYCVGGDLVPNHEIVIVGWDDNYPKENFSMVMRPKNNGAWLIRNSWTNEAELSLSSYFWISYEDSAINQEAAAFFEMMPATGKKENQYRHDGQVTWPDTDSLWLYRGANVFSVMGQGKAKSELLTAVNFYAANVSATKGSNYIVKIVRHLPGKSDPESGGEVVEEAITTGKIYFDGYYTIELAEPVKLEQGEIFSVQVEFDNANLARESMANLNNEVIFKSVMHEGESFYKLSEYGGWNDLYDSQSPYTYQRNLLIGAITEDW